MDTLKERIGHIDKVFGIENIQALKPDLRWIKNYYKANRFAYSLFHTRSGIIHMGLSEGNKFQVKDLLAQAKILNRIIVKENSHQILELATGRGGTSAYLASLNPDRIFTGVDLSPAQLAYAEKTSWQIENFHLQWGDYHKLSALPDDHFDLVFVIEALCYSTEKRQVFREVKRILKKNGLFIVIDAYRRKSSSESSKIEELVYTLTARSMAVPTFHPVTEIFDIAKRERFFLEENSEHSQKLLPTLQRFEKQALLFFFLPTLMKRFILRTFSPLFTLNLVAGYLMAPSVKEGLWDYFITVFRKE